MPIIQCRIIALDNTGDILGQLGKTSAWPTYRQLFKSLLHSLNSTMLLYCLLLHHVRCIKRLPVRHPENMLLN